MHILVINDDGPPSNAHSPYVHSLVRTLQQHGHVVSVVLPDVQRSWIGKAHFVSQIVKPTYFRPGTLHEDNGTVHSTPLPEGAKGEEWVLIDGTPATCAQLGIYHFYQDRGPVDLVISGPNYGRNSSALYSTSSGTIGGAMEAAMCNKRAIALSYAFESREHDAQIIAAASNHAVKVIEYLYKNWGEDVDLYSVNVPVIDGVEKNKVMFTFCLDNRWKESAYKEVEAENTESQEQVASRDKEDREHSTDQKPAARTESDNIDHARHQHRYFKWAPSHATVRQGVVGSTPGNDGLTITQGCTSITPLKALFAEAKSHELGEIKLSPSSPKAKSKPTASAKLNIYIDYEDHYVQPLLLEALSVFPPSSYNLVNEPLPDEPPADSKPTLHIMQFEKLSHTALLSSPSLYFGNAYTQRAALIRKNQLAATVSSYVSKHPGCLLGSHVPTTVAFELDYAEFLDDALVEAFELHDSWTRNEGRKPVDREWWILKPALADRGQGLRLFSSEQDLSAIFEEWEAANPEESDEDEDEDEDTNDDDGAAAGATEAKANNKGLITSLLRHFVAQPYIAPLLFPSLGNRKFHVRAYVLATGALRVYLYRDMLALFAAEEYLPPGVASGGHSHGGPEEEDEHEEAQAPASLDIDMRRHLTNTCLQDQLPVSSSSSKPRPEDTVHRYWSLPSLSLQNSFTKISALVAELFTAAAAQPTTFQPLPNAFEVYGVDFLIDAEGEPWLLEVNAFPDFAQTGNDLKKVVRGLWSGVLGRVGREVVGMEPVRVGKGGGGEEGEGEVDEWGFVRVLDLDMRRR